LSRRTKEFARITHMPTIINARQRLINVGCLFNLFEHSTITRIIGRLKWEVHILRTRNKTNCACVPRTILTGATRSSTKVISVFALGKG